MEMEMENAYSVDYNGKIQINIDTIIVSIWNRLIAEGSTGCEVFPNDKEFFDRFENLYDVAWAASNGSYRRTDEFAYFSSEGHLMSFSQLGDDTCPIDMDRFDISSLINELLKLQKLQKLQKGYVADISPAIHDALLQI